MPVAILKAYHTAFWVPKELGFNCPLVAPRFSAVTKDVVGEETLRAGSLAVTLEYGPDEQVPSSILDGPGLLLRWRGGAEANTLSVKVPSRAGISGASCCFSSWPWRDGDKSLNLRHSIEVKLRGWVGHGQGKRAQPETPGEMRFPLLGWAESRRGSWVVAVVGG